MADLRNPTPTSVRPNATINQKEKSGDGGSNSTVKGKRWMLAWAMAAVGAICVFGPGGDRVRKAAMAPTNVAYSTPALELMNAALAPILSEPLESGAFLDNLMVAWALVGVVGLADIAIARNFGAGRYFALHTMVNAAVVYFSWAEGLEAARVSNPYDINTCVVASHPCSNKLALDLTIAVHLWHALAYALKPIDWIHHVPSYIICGIGIYYPYGFINSVGLLILMGVPGGIDYLLLTLVKIKVLPPRVEKDLNQSLNVWIRHPLSCLSGLIIIGGSLLHPEYFTSEYHRFFHGAAATRTRTILHQHPRALLLTSRAYAFHRLHGRAPLLERLLLRLPHG